MGRHLTELGHLDRGIDCELIEMGAAQSNGLKWDDGYTHFYLRTVTFICERFLNLKVLQPHSVCNIA
jgi:hypothetical protein